MFWYENRSLATPDRYTNVAADGFQRHANSHLPASFDTRRKSIRTRRLAIEKEHIMLPNIKHAPPADGEGETRERDTGPEVVVKLTSQARAKSRGEKGGGCARNVGETGDLSIRSSLSSAAFKTNN